MKERPTRYDLLLLITTLIWGGTFIVVKWSIAKIDPYFFIFCRFLVAFLILIPFFHDKLRQNWRPCLKPGLILGLILALAYIAQTLGLKFTTATASGFITGLSVILVAILAAIINRRLPHQLVLLGILAASFGLLLITFKGTLVFAKGDLLTLFCAVLFAIHVVYTERFGQNRSAGVLTIIQFAVVTLGSGLAYLFFGDYNSLNLQELNIWHWASFLYCGLLATAVAFLFQTKAQQKVPTFRTAILLATEPLFAGIFAIGFGFDPFEWKVVGGGLLIFIGMILASWDCKVPYFNRSSSSARSRS